MRDWKYGAITSTERLISLQVVALRTANYWQDSSETSADS